MDVRILHHHEPGFGWSFDSPDVPGLIGGTDDYDPAEAERAARFALEREAQESGRLAAVSIRFEHFVPAGAAACEVSARVRRARRAAAFSFCPLGAAEAAQPPVFRDAGALIAHGA